MVRGGVAPGQRAPLLLFHGRTPSCEYWAGGRWGKSPRLKAGGVNVAGKWGAWLLKWQWRATEAERWGLFVPSLLEGF